MSGPPKISGSDIARYFALLLPPLIADRLFDDASFRTEFGLDSRDAISFGGGNFVGLSTSRTALAVARSDLRKLLDVYEAGDQQYRAYLAERSNGLISRYRNVP